ncbi:MAG: hypothetical protein ACLPPF_09205 [Rhodomicrobium sp.]
MRLVYRLLILAPLATWPAYVSAITLTNHDKDDRTLIVIEGNKQSERLIKAGEKLELCEKSCVIRVPGGEDYGFEGTELVSLEEGLLFFDDPADQGKPDASLNTATPQKNSEDRGNPAAPPGSGGAVSNDGEDRSKAAR